MSLNHFFSLFSSVMVNLEPNLGLATTSQSGAWWPLTALMLKDLVLDIDSTLLFGVY
jgi:hypothetical protein